MKNLLSICSVLFLLALWSCKKVENRVLYEGGTAPVISVNTTSPELEPATENNPAIGFNWTNPNYRFNTGVSSHDVTYTLEFDTLGGNFSSGAKYSTQIAKELSLTFTGKQLNAILGNSMLLQISPRREYTIEARVISSISGSVKIVSSNKVAFKVRPFAPPPKVALPINNEIWLVGGASEGNWNNPLAEPYLTNQKFTKVTETQYELITTLKANDGFLVLPVMGSWSTKYCLEDGVDRAGTVSGGAFVFKGGGGQDFLSPTPGGTFKLTFDFQLGRFTVVRQ